MNQLSPVQQWPATFHRPTELCLFSAADRQLLLQVVLEWERRLESGAPPLLAEVAYTLACRATPAPACLAIVAANTDELAKKLAHARKRLEDSSCQRIQDRSGIFYFDKQHRIQGKLAFLFPGEGAQYANMLLDVCLDFPVAREAFDTVDRACALAGDDFVPSQRVYAVPDQQGTGDGDTLWTMEAAIEAMIAADSALMRVFNLLAIVPDGVIGHSSGEFMALEASGAVTFESEEERLRSIADGYLLIKTMTGQARIAESALVTVGGVEIASVERLIDQCPGQARIAMANCPHQYVLCVEPEWADTVTEALVQEGAVVTRLPFDRPYHTPLFEPALEGIRQHFRKYTIKTPDVELYSCATAERFPDEPESIRELGVAQWAKPVRFQETIERMFEAGYRTFVELGPRGNLSAFVQDILKGQPHLAVATDRAHRSSLTQLHHALGLLAAHGVRMEPAALHAHRFCRSVCDAETDEAKPPRPQRLYRFSSALPVVKPPDTPPAISARKRAATHPADPPQRRGRRDQAMLQYLENMKRFLALQEEVSERFLARRIQQPVRQPVSRAKPGSASAPDGFPLLGEISPLQPGDSLSTTQTYRVEREVFLKHHTLGTTISTLHPDLTGFPVMPLTMTLEIMAEAAQALFPDHVVVGFTDVEATRWITFETGEKALRVEARAVSTDRCPRVRVWIGETTLEENNESIRPRIAECTVHLAPEFPEKPTLPGWELKGERSCDWSGEAIYPERLFHGECFQALERITRWGENGLEGTVRVLPRAKLLQSNARPAFATDPVLLDAVGATLGVWGAYEPLTGQVLFPFRVGAIHLYGPPLPEGDTLAVQLHVKDTSSSIAVADMCAYDDNGHLYLLIEDWHDRIFDVTPALHGISHRPLERFYCNFPDWRFVPPPPNDLVVYAATPAMPDRFFESSHGIWGQVLKFIALNEDERAELDALEGNRDRKLQWLLGRIAAKDAVRRYLRERHGLRLGAADVLIHADEHGRPYAAGFWQESVPESLSVSLTHSGSRAAAVAGDSRFGELGIDMEHVYELSETFLQAAFTAEELAHLDDTTDNRNEWALRAWCAKEALGKAYGWGITVDPRSIRCSITSVERGEIEVSPPASWQTGDAPTPGPVLISTLVQEGSCIALCRLPKQRTANIV